MGSSEEAAAPTRFPANVYIGFETQLDASPTIHSYGVPQFESAGGRSLALTIADRCREAGTQLQPTVTGMRLPVLRETRMPAVLIMVGPVQEALDEAADLVQAMVDALEIWATGSPPTPLPKWTTE